MVSKKSTFLNWENQTWYWEKMWLFSIGNGAEIRPLEMGRKSPAITRETLISDCSKLGLNKELRKIPKDRGSSDLKKLQGEGLIGEKEHSCLLFQLCDFVVHLLTWVRDPL